MLTPLSLEEYVYQQAGNLRIISDSRIRQFLKVRNIDSIPGFHSYINFDKYREEIASAFNNFGNR